MEKMPTAILVEIRRNIERSGLAELERLAEAAGYSVIGKYEQTRMIDSAFCMGRGRARELATELESSKSIPDKVIFNNRLKPSQVYNLTKTFKTEVIDRFQLILEIFTKRAGTIEAKCQIELAKLQYELPLAKEKVHLAKLGELPGFHGLGRYQADVYTSMIKKRISYLKKRLNEIRIQKSLHRKKRKRDALFNVALTGYTCAGKTTLFNLLSEEALPVSNNLFTTLSTTTRSVQVNGRKILFSDTVGFIDRLPHQLIDAFYSTLEEVTLADLVLLVLDASDPIDEFKRKLDTCISALNTIGVFTSSIIPVLNKIDLNSALEQYSLATSRYFKTNPIMISAKDKKGIDDLVKVISGMLPQTLRLHLRMPISENAGSLLSWALSESDIKSVKFDDRFLDIETEVSADYVARFNRLIRGSGIQLMKVEEVRVHE